MMRNPKWQGNGWYNATNTRRFHWFDEIEKPICGKYVKGFPDEFCHSSGPRMGEKPTDISFYTGGCKNCIKKLEQKLKTVKQ